MSFLKKVLKGARVGLAVARETVPVVDAAVDVAEAFTEEQAGAATTTDVAHAIALLLDRGLEARLATDPRLLPAAVAVLRAERALAAAVAATDLRPAA